MKHQLRFNARVNASLSNSKNVLSYTCPGFDLRYAIFDFDYYDLRDLGSALEIHSCAKIIESKRYIDIKARKQYREP